LSNSRVVRLGIFTTIFAASIMALSQQDQPHLQIESPADGTLVHPGQTITIRVTSPSGVNISMVTVGGEDPLPFMTQQADSLPAEFSIIIPAQIDSRIYSLKAMGATKAGALLVADVDLDIERIEAPRSISSFQFPSLRLETTSPPFNLIILADFPDQKYVTVTYSSYLSYRSTNPAVATVDKLGAIKAIAPGAASIQVTYKTPDGSKVQVAVPVTVSLPDTD
jgi:hypothetical protein